MANVTHTDKITNANNVSINDEGNNFTSNNVEGALEELSGGQSGFEEKSNKDVVNGYAGLDANSKINQSEIPAIAVTDVYTASSESGQLGLTVQEGDVCVRTDENKSYIALNSDNVDMSDWQELLSPTDAVQSVFSRTGVVTAQNNDYTWSQIDKTTSSIADITTKNHSDLNLDDGNNPHGTTKSDVGLGNVPNVDCTDADNINDGTTNAIITQTQESNFEDAYSHISRTDNPHSTSDQNLITSDVTDNNTSTTKHGFCPKLDNDKTHFLDGQGNWNIPIFGSEYEYTSDETNTNTSSDSYINILTLTTATKPAGKYRISFTCEMKPSSSTGAMAQFTVAGTEINEVKAQYTIDYYSPRTSFFEYNLTSDGTIAAEINFKRTSGSGSIDIRRSRIELWRVS